MVYIMLICDVLLRSMAPTVIPPQGWAGVTGAGEWTIRVCGQSGRLEGAARADHSGQGAGEPGVSVLVAGRLHDAGKQSRVWPGAECPCPLPPWDLRGPPGPARRFRGWRGQANQRRSE